jgi:hypothetical protein
LVHRVWAIPDCVDIAQSKKAIRVTIVMAG